MSKALDKAKELAKKTNAAVMVVNETTNEVFVVMTVDEYEKLINTETQKHRNTETQRQQADSREPEVVAENRKPKADSGDQVELGRLTEEELLAKISQDIKAWRNAQVNQESFALAGMPKEVVFKDEKGERGAYNLSGVQIVEVSPERNDAQAFSGEAGHLEDEERFFLDDLD